MEALWQVHLVDGYPIDWPADPGAWLNPPALAGAWVAVIENRIVGHAGVEHHDGRGLFQTDDALPRSSSISRFAIVTRLFVRPTARGSGSAAQLLSTVCAQAAAADRVAVLEVIDGTAAVATYERLGWRLLQVRSSDWTARDGLHRSVRIYRQP